MKKVWMLIAFTLLLSGCGAVQTFETIGDVYAPQQTPEPREVVFVMPEDAAAKTMESENGSFYFCDGYEISVQVLPSGDLNRTVQTLTGYERNRLTLMETAGENEKRYEFVWTSAGEAGDYVGRSVILDDGNYHYCLSVMALAQEAGSLQESWQSLLLSMELQD